MSAVSSLVVKSIKTATEMLLEQETQERPELFVNSHNAVQQQPMSEKAIMRGELRLFVVLRTELQIPIQVIPIQATIVVAAALPAAVAVWEVLRFLVLIVIRVVAANALLQVVVLRVVAVPMFRVAVVQGDNNEK